MDAPLDWHDLEIFHAVMEHGSFSAAARALGMSQPTVSRHIEALERTLGRELFARAAGGLEPSALARDLGQRTAEMSDSMFGVQRLLDGHREIPQGIVTLSLPYGMGGLVLLQALKGFELAHPEVSLDLRFGPPQSNLGRREADIDLRWSQPTEPEVICLSMGTWLFGLYATPEYLERHGTPQTAADLNEHLFPYVDEAVMKIWLEAMAERGVKLHRFPFRCTGNLLLQVFMGIDGRTLSSMPVNLQSPLTVRVLPEFSIASPPIWLAMHSALRRNAAIRAVWNWLAERLPASMRRTHE
jgi:DNA-binding transcriptional LysR family regulator